MESHLDKYGSIISEPDVNPKCFLVVTTFQKCNTLDFKLYFGKLNNKILPIWCYVNFVAVFTALNNYTNIEENLTLHHMGICYTVTFFKSFFNTNKIE